MVKIISIEGNIGSGKSTIVQNLKKYSKSDYIFVQEPVDEWKTICDESGESILSHFYKDNKRYSFQFQMMAYISRLNILRNIIKTNPNAIIITERCLFTDKYVFAKMLYESGNMTKIEYDIYNKWFETFITDIPIDGIFYVKTTPEICEERIKRRNRNGENIPLNYLNTCHEYHERWLNKNDTPVTLYDGNVEISEENIISVIKQIDSKIHEIFVEKTIAMQEH
jgi:deoxyadenosine/deoxycytidine kinase